jgi:hypothetical protein
MKELLFWAGLLTGVLGLFKRVRLRLYRRCSPAGKPVWEIDFEYDPTGSPAVPPRRLDQSPDE